MEDPSAASPLSPPDAADVMCAWSLIGRFGEALDIAPFSPEALCAALQRPGDSVLLAEIHMRVLRDLLQNSASLRETQLPPPAVGGHMFLQQVPTPDAVNPNSWPEVLRVVLLLIPNCEAPSDALEAMRLGSYI